MVDYSVTSHPGRWCRRLLGELSSAGEYITLADSLGGGIGLENRYTFELVRRFVDEYLVVDEAQIAEGMRQLHRGDSVVAEGGASVGVAAVLAGLVDGLEGNVVFVISGANVDMDKFARIMNGEYDFG